MTLGELSGQESNASVLRFGRVAGDEGGAREDLEVAEGRALNKRDLPIAIGTVEAAERGEGILLDSAVNIAKKLGKSLGELLDASELPRDLRAKWIHEWEEVRPLVEQYVSSNGLSVEIWQLRHRYLDRFARGKRYELEKLSNKEKSRIEHCLRRHPEVCGRFQGNPHIPVNLTALPSDQDDCWWVIDEWTPGVSLSKILASDRVPLERVCRIVAGIAEGLAAMHGLGISTARVVAEVCDFEGSR